MDILVIGSGPTGLTLGAALARRGHRVTSVDRDPGPDAGGGWPRRGVMQFAHAHNFRPQVSWLLQSEWPEAFRVWRSLGPEPTDLEELGLSGDPVIVHSRRVTYERALRIAAADVPGLALGVGHVDRLLEERGRVVGAVVDGTRSGGRPRGGRLRAGLPALRFARRPRRGLRDGVRRPLLPPAPGCRAGAGQQPDRMVRQLRRLPGAGVPTGAGLLLGGADPADGRYRPQAAAAPGRLRGGLSGDPRPRGLDRPPTVAPGDRRAGRRGAAQRLPAPAHGPRSRRGRGRRLDDHADGGPWGGDGQPAGRRAARASSMRDRAD